MSTPTLPPNAQPLPRRISGTGEMAQLTRDHDWSATPLGPIDSWPLALLNAVNITLSCGFPALTFWGPQMIQFYNDGYRAFMDGKHPAALGMSAEACWPEAWHIIGPEYHAVLERGETFHHENVIVPVIRDGLLQDRYWTYSHSPIFEADGTVCGIFVVCQDTTSEVVARRDLAESEARASRVLQSIGDAVIVTDADCRVTRMNPIAEQLTGWAIDDARGHSLAEVFHIVNETTRKLVESPADKVKRLGTIVGLANHTTLIARNGAETNIDDSGAPVRNEAGELVGIVLVFRDITERRRAERERDTIASQLQQVMEVTTDSIVIIDRDWRITYLNPPARKTLESSGEVLGRNHWEAFPESNFTGSPWLEHYYRAMDQRLPGQFEAYYPEPLNVWLDIFVRPTLDGIAVFFRDVSEQRKLSKALEQNEERLRIALTASNAVGIYDWDVPNDLVYADPNFARLYRVDPESARTGITIAEFIRYFHPDDLERVTEEIAVAVKTGEPFHSEYRLVQADGSAVWVTAVGRCSLSPEGKPLRFSGVTIDITERKQIEENLRASEERLRIAAETASLGTWELDLAETRLVCSPICKLNYGRSADDPFPYAELLEAIHPEDREAMQASVREAVENHTPLRIEYRITWPDGSPHWMIVNGRGIYSPSGEPLRMVGVSMNVTERHQATEALMQTEKLAAVGRLAASIAHEINNPLESVTNLLYLARTSEDLPEVQQYLDTAERELRRVSVISNQTLRFHKQSTRPQPVASKDIIDSVLSIHQGRVLNSGVHIEKRYRPTPPVLCFEGEIRQVLNNLIGNAIDAMYPGGGRLLLRSREATDWTTGQRGIVLTVADTGTGMGPQTALKVFDPFFTTKGIGGTGLGLWVSKEIVARHHGSLRVRSSQNPHQSGTTFTLFLPFAAATR